MKESIILLYRSRISFSVKSADAGVNNLDQIRPHTTRVTAATMPYRKSNSVKAVQTLLGHTKPSMTDKYIKGLDSYDLLKDLI